MRFNVLADIALVSLGDKTKKPNDLFALERPGFESHTDVLYLSLSCHFLCYFYYYCETTDTADENRICDYIICDRLFSHMGQVGWLC